jgi:hypothetical protein
MVESMKRSCGVCGGELRFSHREYAARGATRVVWRCRACGAVAHDAPLSRQEAAPRPRSRKPLPDEGPPPNPVLDEDAARRLRDLMGDG